MPMTSKEMVSLLRDNGFVEVWCGNGSHRKFQNPKTHKTVVIPYHTKDLGIGFTNAILKQAGLK